MGRHNPAARHRPVFAPIERLGPDETLTRCTLAGLELGRIVGKPEFARIRRYTIILLGEVIGERLDYYEARRVLVQTWEDQQ